MRHPYFGVVLILCAADTHVHQSCFCSNLEVGCKKLKTTMYRVFPNSQCSKVQDIVSYLKTNGIHRITERFFLFYSRSLCDFYYTHNSYFNRGERIRPTFSSKLFFLEYFAGESRILYIVFTLENRDS